LAAQLNFPSGIVVDPTGIVLFSDSFNNRVRKLMAQAAAPLVTAVDAAVVNAASLQPGPVAPGEVVTLYAPGIGPEIGVAAHVDALGMLETTLAETQVQFDGTAAPIFYAQSGQINLQVPYGVSGSTQMEVFYKGISRVRLVLPVAESAPGLYTAITNQDGSINSPDNAAPRDSIVTLLATGEGALTPAGISGRAAQDPGPQPVLPVTLRIAGNPSEILSAASAPGMIGLLQISARVPGGFVPTGILPVVLSVGDAGSQSGVTIAVK
jgi:uncharacterized protein (TIGR03437 family)